MIEEVIIAAPHLITPDGFSDLQKTAVSFGVIYQIYPASFADGNGDGMGDLPGIIDRLGYLQDLGVDSIWLSPHYPSPWVDCGYDVADYTDVAERHGTLADFERLLAAVHDRDMKVIIDGVFNHTSDRHPWFLESRSSRDSPKRDWYVWHPGIDGRPPNNWYSAFGGRAWTLDETTGEYYYHFFFAEQPDLNWHNPEVQRAMFDAFHFWLDLGVDGFRLDAIGTIFEDPELTDQSCPVDQLELLERRLTASTDDEEAALGELHREMFARQVEQPGVHELFQELRAEVDGYGDKLLLGETGHLDYHGDGEDELHLVFNFPLMNTDRITPGWVRANQADRLASLPPGAWPCNTLGNHDRSRLRTHFGDGAHDEALARVNAALVLTLRGTPVLYNGEEIGMSDLLLEDPALLRDGISVWAYRTTVTELGMSRDRAVRKAALYGRDRARTPMQWADAENAGFSPGGVTTWLPVNPNHRTGISVAAQAGDRASTLEFYRRLLQVRRRLPAILFGDYTPVHDEARDYLGYRRQHDGEVALVFLSYSTSTRYLALEEGVEWSVAFSSNPDRDGDVIDPHDVRLGSFEVLILEPV